MKYDLKNILQSIEIPEPDKDAKKATINAFLHEFNKQNYSAKENRKGIKDEWHLISILRNSINHLMNGIMKKQFVVAGSATAFIVLLVFGMIYYSDSIIDNRAGNNQNDLDKEGFALSETDHGKNIMPLANSAPRKDSEQGDLVAVIKENGLQKESEQPEIVVALNESKQGNAKSDNEKQRQLLRKMAKSIKPMNMYSFYSEHSNNDLGIVEPLLRKSATEMAFEGYNETGRNKFDKITANRVQQVSEEPVSTFSIDVDTSSYTFVRRQLNNGRYPQKNAVRVEEMINYFNYDYPVPTDKSKPFKPTVAIYPTPWNDDTKLLHIGIKGYDIVQEDRPRANLVFLIDVSGSMKSNDKLPLLKNSLRMLVNSLDDEDTIAIVVYAGAAGTVLEPTRVKEKGKILAALDQLQAGGSTAGGEGIRRAYELAEANFDKDSVNRVILATDGDFNVGIRDPEELKSFIERKRDTGVFLSVLGFGNGNYNDALMQKLAQNGNGNAAYIDSLNEARKVLVEESGATLFIIAKDVKIQVEFNPELIAEYRLIGYESRMLNREDFKNDKVDAGDIGAGHSVTAIYEITPVGSKGKLIEDLRYSGNGNKSDKAIENNFDQEYAFLKIRYKLPDAEQSQLMTTPISVENEYEQIDRAPYDFRFAASVAAFGQILRGGTYTGDFSYDEVLKLAQSAMDKDRFGYRHEFLNLVRLAKTLKK